MAIKKNEIVFSLTHVFLYFKSEIDFNLTCYFITQHK